MNDNLKIKSIAIKNSFTNLNSNQEKMLRSKSKNAYGQRKNVKNKTYGHYPFPRIAPPKENPHNEINNIENDFKSSKNNKNIV